ncbi:MAG TPA: methyltransferase domain-containing protein [Steroidobacteraceae bacterium]|nr:methyltransferase domain-containing protein [Steroidobacteraceae bacterium]
MKSELLLLLRCPRTGQALVLEPGAASSAAGEIDGGWLVTADGAHRYPIRDGIPRFVPASNYADNFGMQWNKFRLTQLDSHSGQSISADRFWKATGWRPAELRGKWVLDVGCGAGRFAEVVLEAGARLVALDYSSAADACFANLRRFPQLHVVQGDVYALPFPPESFDFVYSLGVLQHTPDVHRSFAALPPMVAPGGQLCVDYYWRRIRTMLHLKYALRPITKRMPQQKLFALLEANVPWLLRVSQSVRRVPLIGRGLQRLVPIVDYTGIYPLNAQQLKEWALLDTFDMFAPAHDNPQTPHRVRAWFDSVGFSDIDVFHEGHLVARGRKPITR